MARHPEHPGDPYMIPVVVKMNAQGLAVLDRLRGDTPRSTFLRDLVRAENQRRRSN